MKHTNSLIKIISITIFLTGLFYNSLLSQEISGTGTIKFFSFEGGFWGLISDDNNNYLPNNLKPEFKVDNLKVKFTGKVLIDVMTTQNWGTPFQLIDMSLIGIEKGYEVHEWGVLDGCFSNDKYFLTSRPEKSSMIKQPVVYFHFKDKTPFSFEVTFNSGKPTDTYPVAKVSDNKIEWKNVTFPDMKRDLKSNKENPKDFVPLSEIIPYLNDVDADELVYNGERSKFLFYEGEMNFKNEISVEEKNGQLVFVNNSSYTVYCLTYVKSKEYYWIRGNDADIYFIDSLEAGTSKPGNLINLDNQELPLSLDMKSLGFTNSEIKSFITLWSSPFYSPGNHNHRNNIFYRIPVEVYNSMISLNFSPEPEKIIRVLYILAHNDR